MPNLSLQVVLSALIKSFDETAHLASAAAQWSSVRLPTGVLKFTLRHKEIMTELAFLKAFLAWEMFLEQSFVLYLLGMKPHRGSSPRCYISPPTRKVAEQLIVPEGKDFVDWTTASTVISRAERFFVGGKPYAPALNSQINFFNKMKTLRNAITHSSSSAHEKFKRLTRDELTIYPSNLTTGGFLAMTVPGSSPPESFLESYLSNIRIAAKKIVPN